MAVDAEMVQAQETVGAIVDWLIDGAPPSRRPQDAVAELCERLLACGLPLHRVAVFVRTLHPNVMGRRFLWRPAQEVEVSGPPHEYLETEGYLASPIRLVMNGHGTIRRHLVDPDCPNDFGILEELRAEGVTDYLIQPLAFSNGEIHAVSWTTIRPEGFSKTDIAALEAIVRPLARVVEIHALRRVASTLLDTYVGHGAGERILQGRIRRGDIEDINAVILSSDLRGFTELSDRLPGHEVVSILNHYFDCLVPPIEAAGGEVLKFMGDGLLAIFPVGDQAAAACEAALAAIAEARAKLSDADRQAAAKGRPALRHGSALHLGEVLYGNVGSATRLDFTTIGPAVNLAARLQTLSRDLGREIVLSSAVAACLPDAVISLGRFELRGIREPQDVFAPA
jgi:adenylate cyclase